MSDFVTYDEWWMCESCNRLTVTGLCGCPKPDPFGPVTLTWKAPNVPESPQNPKETLEAP